MKVVRLAAEELKKAQKKVAEVVVEAVEEQQAALKRAVLKKEAQVLRELALREPVRKELAVAVEVDVEVAKKED